MNCQILFYGKNKKTISKCRLLQFLTQHAQCYISGYHRLNRFHVRAEPSPIDKQELECWHKMELHIFYT